MSPWVRQTLNTRKAKGKDQTSNRGEGGRTDSTRLSLQVAWCDRFPDQHLPHQRWITATPMRPTPPVCGSLAGLQLRPQGKSKRTGARPGRKAPCANARACTNCRARINGDWCTDDPVCKGAADLDL